VVSALLPLIRDRSLLTLITLRPLLTNGTCRPGQVTTDGAPVYPRVVEEARALRLAVKLVK